MRKEEYINEVISKIENKKARREVEKELSAHIDDRISYYTDAGYDEETANIKAMEHMGEPENVGVQMASLYKKLRWYEYSVLLPLLFFLFVTCFFQYFSAIEGSISVLAIFEPIFIALLLGISHFGRKKGSIIVTFISVISFAAYCFEYVYILYREADGIISNFCSSTVITAIYSFTFKFGAVSDLAGMCHLEFAWWVTALSIMFYAFIAVLLIYSFVSVCKSFDVKSEFFMRVTETAMKCIAVFSMIVCVCAFIPFGGVKSAPDRKYSDFFIVQNDKQISVTEKDINAWISIDWDWEEYFESMELKSFNDEPHFEFNDYSSEIKTVEYDSIVSHRVCFWSADYKPTKNYIYFISGVSAGYNEFWFDGKGVWFSTDEEQLLKIKVDKNNYIYLRILARD